MCRVCYGRVAISSFRDFLERLFIGLVAIIAEEPKRDLDSNTRGIFYLINKLADKSVVCVYISILSNKSVEFGSIFHP